MPAATAPVLALLAIALLVLAMLRLELNFRRGLEGSPIRLAEPVQ